MSTFIVLFNSSGGSEWSDPSAARELLAKGFARPGIPLPVAFSSWSSPDGSFAAGYFPDPQPKSTLSPIYVAPDRTEALLLDGTIHNPAELEALLGLPADPFRSIHRTLFAAYRQWGDRFAEKLSGDFALVLWDGKERKLLCARDILGIKSVYYTVSGQTVALASAIRPLSLLPSFEYKLDTGFLAEYLASHLTSREATVFQNVKRLTPAHVLTSSPGNLAINRYWDLIPKTVPSERGEFELCSEFKDLFFRAVSRRMAGTRKLAVQLSGGLDSSAILAVAHSLRMGAFPSLDLRAFSLVFPGQPWDESQFSSALVATLQNLPQLTLEPVIAQPEWAKAEIEAFRDLPNYPNGMLGAQSLEQIKSRGIKHVLHGLGGDEILTGGAFSYSSLLSRGDLRSAWQQARGDQQLKNRLSDLLPQSLKNLLKRASPGLTWIPPWITAQFVRESSLHDRLKQSVTGPDGVQLSPQQYRTYQALMNGWAVHIREIEARSAAAIGVEVLYPFFDRELIEFCFSLPDEILQRGGLSKFVLRQSLQGMLPPSILERRDKADFSFVGVELLEAIGGRAVFENLKLYECGWIDRNVTLGLYDQMLRWYGQSDPRYVEPSWILWNLYGGERVIHLA